MRFPSFVTALGVVVFFADQVVAPLPEGGLPDNFWSSLPTIGEDDDWPDIFSSAEADMDLSEVFPNVPIDVSPGSLLDESPLVPLDMKDQYAFIDCPGPLPQAFFPPERPRELFNNLQSLCSFAGLFVSQFSVNMGCGCRDPTNPFGGAIHCYRPPVADPLLWDVIPLREHCHRFCRCRNVPEGTPGYTGIYYGDPAIEKALRSSGPIDHRRPRPQPSSLSRSSSDSDHSSKDLANNLPSDCLATSHSHRSALTRCPSCMDPCSSNADCNSHPNCRCAALSRVGRDRSHWQSWCGILSPRSGIGRRTLDLVPDLNLDTPPCVCNATYVSHACCAADDGLVFEHPSFRLGALLNETVPDL
ncbi:MAG: hypothetical protein M1824_003642 [Vezdaea acicularis]|nr:MAG: hypothetical protein M1824_003642 [Vezdaea acicularis]